ncbi:MAG TPA: hypothetical protein VFX21_05130 [Acidimicrobiia bacterium]|nr:hypothetical protein [Acidimicrobiia bacterium]
MFEHLDDPHPSGPELTGLEDARVRGRVLRNRRRSTLGGGATLALVLLIAGASVAWSADDRGRVNVGDGDTPTSAAVDATTTTEPEAEAPWVEHVDETGGYRILFPVEPTGFHVSTDVSARLELVDDHSYAAEDDGGRYQIRWFDVPAEAATDPAALMQELAEYWASSSSPGELSGMTETTSFGNPAADFVVTERGAGDDETDVVRHHMIVRGTRVYWMATSVTAAADGSHERFVGSFSFLEEQTTTTTRPTTDERPPTTTTTTPTVPTSTPATDWSGPRVEMPTAFPAGDYIDPAGRFSTSLPTLGYSRYFFVATWFGGPPVHDYWIASDTGEYLDELRVQDYAPGTIADADGFARRLAKYWCSALDGSFGSEPVTTTEKDRPAVRFRCDHPVSGATSYSWSTIIVDGDRVYWLNTSAFVEQPAEHRHWIDLLQILG